MGSVVPEVPVRASTTLSCHNAVQSICFLMFINAPQTFKSLQTQRASADTFSNTGLVYAIRQICRQVRRSLPRHSCYVSWKLTSANVVVPLETVEGSVEQPEQKNTVEKNIHGSRGARMRPCDKRK